MRMTWNNKMYYVETKENNIPISTEILHNKKLQNLLEKDDNNCHIVKLQGVYEIQLQGKI